MCTKEFEWNYARIPVHAAVSTSSGFQLASEITQKLQG